MNIVSRILTALLLLLVVWLALQCMNSPDWRDRALGTTVVIVYILIGVCYATRIGKRRKLG